MIVWLLRILLQEGRSLIQLLREGIDDVEFDEGLDQPWDYPFCDHQSSGAGRHLEAVK